MKLILAIMPNHLSEIISKILLENSYRVTKFASTASLLTGGTTTLMLGTQAKNIDACLALIRENIPRGEPTDPAHARVTIYVLKIKDFERV